MNKEDELVEDTQSPMEKNKNAEVSGVVYVASNLLFKKWIAIILAASALFFLILIIAVVFLLKNSDNLNYATNNFFANEEYTKLYQEVESVVSSYQSKYGVKVDKYLIISALTAYQDNEMYFDKTESGAYDEFIAVEDEDSEGATISRSVDAMTAKIEILAKYQIKTNSSCSYDSSTMRNIASNDDSNNLLNFWTSAAYKEKNYDCNGGSGYSLSTEEGNIADENSGSTFYWNLIDENFLKEYYPEYFSGINDELYESHAAEAIEYIYLYASALKELDCDNGGGSNSLANNFTSIDVSCPTVNVLPDANGNYGGTYQLEEYIAGVLSDEFSPSYMKSISGDDNAVKENLKTFAIVVRSYTIARSNGCTKSIRNSSNDQNFKPTDDALIWEAVNSTAGMVLTYNGNIITAEYDSYNCRGGSTSCTYTKIPGSTTHTVTIPSSWTRFAAGGHGRGMSQIGALYLATTGMNHQEIATYFYDDSVQIQQLSGTSSTPGGGSNAYCQRSGSLSDGNGTCDGTSYYGGKEVGKEYLIYEGNPRPFTLLTCTADQTELALKEIYNACGPIPHAGSMRQLTASVGEHRSSTSFHYTGRAFDLATNEGMQSGDSYYYVTHEDTSGNDNSHYYRLYCEVINDVESQYISEKSIIPLKWSGNRVVSKTSVTKKFMDVTAVLNAYGLYSIAPRSCLKDGNYMCAEWWHFQDVSGLEKGTTTFRQALDQYHGIGTSYAGTPVSSHLNKKWNGGYFG